MLLIFRERVSISLMLFCFLYEISHLMTRHVPASRGGSSVADNLLSFLARHNHQQRNTLQYIQRVTAAFVLHLYPKNVPVLVLNTLTFAMSYLFNHPNFTCHQDVFQYL